MELREREWRKLRGLPESPTSDPAIPAPGVRLCLRDNASTRNAFPLTV